MSQRELKEAFVSNLNGTSLQEVALGSFLAPLCLIQRGLILILYHQAKGTLPLPLPLISHLLLDFSVLVLPLVLSCTVLSSSLHQVIVSLAVVSACVVFFIYRNNTRPSTRHQSTISTFFQSHVQFDQVPFVTLFRVLVNVKTAISILAVDFSVYPRRYAKAEIYGTGVMDFGVGAYVFANALVCPEARGKNISGSKKNHITKQLLSVWPLVVLGMVRLVSVKMTGYHEHVREYGVHWNFFFTLAIVRVVTSVILAVLPARRSWIFALLIGGLYQLALETSGLKDFILYNNDREKDFLHANKEGIFSVLGYVAIYMAGVQVGLYVMQPRSQVSCTTAKLEEVMARLVAVCREGEEEYPFLARQIPLFIDDTLTYHSKLKQQDLNLALMVTSREVYSALSQLVPCVGCRRSVERLFSHLVESGNPALEPLTVKPTGMLSVTKSCLADAKKLYTLFYIHGGSWMDVWELMSQECRDEVVLIDSASLLETLETYLRKHRFCTDCKNKVLRAYNILVGELDCSKEKGYCAALYEGLCCCPHERHIHVCCETDFIAHLLGRAEPEFAGGYERRERHAKTIDIAQEEVLTCLGIHLYERLHRIWQKLRAEEQTWQILFHLGIDALRKSFEMAVEKMQGISRLEQFVEELSEEERAKELKQEKKRQKRKNRRKNKYEQETEDKEKHLDEGSLESVDGSCKVCGSHEEEEEEEEARCDESVAAEGSTSCSCPDNIKPDLSPHSNGSDCGYSSSIEGSETGSREGSDIACSEGICNHDEAGDDSNAHHCAEDKEEDGTDSCVDCWPHSEENIQCKSKKKKRKAKTLCNNQGQKGDGCMPDGNTTGHGAQSSHTCRTKEIFSSLCGDTFANIALRLPWTVRQKDLSLHENPPDASISLAELLDDSEVTSDEENCLTEDEIQAFLERNQSFYNNRHQYRQLLKEKFTNYCRATERSKPVCGKWFATTSVN
ncbi:Gametogenetin-binding protein 2 [Collichthys lucidus]|uniref:Gametogenetin-binding protein 2 n=1 Tax=Collichthys lucidus TaxID=240159 RepID=A0A4U5V6Z5_COLLU|nr:Gametogenetin-binding protein 2 [Collichthys lucidus]